MAETARLNSFEVIGNMFESAIGLVNSISASLSQVLLPLVILVMTIWVTNYGIAVYRGDVQKPAMDFIGKNYKMLFFLVFGLSAGVFQQLVVPAVTEAQTAIGNAVLNTALAKIDVAALCQGSVGKPYQILDCYGSLVNNLISAYFTEAAKQGASLNIGGAMMYAILGICLAVLCAAYGAIMAFEVMEARIVLFLVLALGPIFICCGAFETSKNFFNNWVAKLANMVVLNALIVVYVVLAIGIFTATLEPVLAPAQAAAGKMQGIETLLGANLVSPVVLFFQVLTEVMVLGFLALKIPAIASALTGGGYGGSSGAAFMGGLAGGVVSRAIIGTIGKALQKPPGSTNSGGEMKAGKSESGSTTSAPQRARDRANRMQSQ